MNPLSHIPLLLILFALIHSSISVDISNMDPTCAPESSFTVISVYGTGFSNQIINITIGTQLLDPSFIINIQDFKLTFLTPKTLTAGVYPLQVCAQGYTCSQVCVNNCTTPAPINSTCTETCTEECTTLNTTCLNPPSLIVYSLPAILLNIYPSSIAQSTNVSVYGKNFLDCGVATVQLQSEDKVTIFPAWVNSSTEMIFYADNSFTGIITVSLDGQHFDSVSASPIFLTMRGKSTGDSSSSSSDDDHRKGGGPNYIWLYVVLGIVGLAAGSFLVYVIYRYRVKDDYSRLYDL